MDETSIKEKFHRLIDSISDTRLLEGLYEAIVQLEVSQNKKDILDELTKKQLQHLEESLQQSYSGKVVPDYMVREKAEQWLSR
ncbi:MAG: hypothetical protein H3C35_06685 [Bacteroidetes bacterium]|nr:hypothetical protein [Bacteroidota bacterium]